MQILWKRCSSCCVQNQLRDIKSSWLNIWCSKILQLRKRTKKYGLEHNDGQFFRAMEWLIFFQATVRDETLLDSFFSWESHWFLGNHCKFQWFWGDHCKFSMVFEKTITIECFLTVWPLPSMVFQCFFILLPSLLIVFDGSGPLVKRCDGFDGSLWSNDR